MVLVHIDTMLSFTGFQDALNAVLVIIVVSIIVAVAWLSTNVREQPLIATAVVVFQSGVNGEGDSNASATGAVQRENQGGGTRESEMESVRPNPIAKDNESTVMEVRPETEVSPGECKSDEVSLDSKLSEHGVDVVEKEGQSGAEASAVEKDLAQCHSKEAACDEHHEDINLATPSPALSSSSSSENIHDDASQEMEVRNRRLKHFVTMGGSQMTEGLHRTSSLQDVASSPEGGDDKSNESSDGKKESSPPLPTSEGSERPPGSIRIRLKFLDESQKYVFAQPTEQVGSFKR